MPRILVVDDLEENVYAVSRPLKFFGYDVISAHNGLEALEKIKTEHPDLVIMDIHMPMMDGYEACKRMKSDDKTKHIPVIFLTAKFPELDDKVKGLDLGADGYLTKPFNQPELISEVRSLLRIKELYDELSDSKKKLKEYNERLEDMVLARTEELRLAQAKLIQSERLSAVGKLAAEIAHEINNPLAIISNYLRLISYDMTEKDPNHEYLKIIGEELERIVKIVKDLLSFSKPPLNPKAIKLHEEIDKVLNLYQDDFTAKGIFFEQRLDAKNDVVNADPDAIRQVIINLINNSMDAMPHGGRIKLSSLNKDNSIKIILRDTGSGIPAESKKKVFEPFFTTKGSKGTGLGLSICYGIINVLKGSIEVDSEAAKGTSFTITLPQS